MFVYSSILGFQKAPGDNPIKEIYLVLNKDQINFEVFGSVIRQFRFNNSKSICQSLI